MLCHRHLVHFSSRDDFTCIWLHIIMFTWRAFSFQYFRASNFTSNSSMDSALNTGSYLYNSYYVQFVLNSVIRASYMTIKSSGVRTEPRWTSTPKKFSLRQLPTNVLFFMSLIMPFINSANYLLIWKHSHYLPAVLLYVNECDVEWLVKSQEQLL